MPDGLKFTYDRSALLWQLLRRLSKYMKDDLGVGLRLCCGEPLYWGAHQRFFKVRAGGPSSSPRRRGWMKDFFQGARAGV